MKPHPAIVAILFCPVFCLAAPFQNGSFESPNPAAPVPNNKKKIYAAYSSELTGWISAGNVGLTNGLGGSQTFGPIDGSQQIGFNGGDQQPRGSVHQTFDTVAGTVYQVRLYAGRVGPGTGVARLILTLRNGSNTGTYLGSRYVEPVAGQGYTLFEQEFTASGSSTDLSLDDASQATVSVDLVVDGVSVYPKNQPTPTPGIALYGGVSVSGEVGTLYRVDVTDELKDTELATNWRVVTIVTLPVSPYFVFDRNSPGKPRRFYRVTALTDPATP